MKKSMDPRLHKAATLGNMDLLNEIAAENNGLLLSTTPRENTALHLASRFGHQDFAGEILRQCPSLISRANSKGDTPLHVASRAGHVGIAGILIKSAQELAGNIRSFSLRDAESVEDEVGSREIWRMGNKENNTALHEAVRNGHLQVVVLLLRTEEDLACMVNNAGESPLYLAAEKGSPEIVRKILSTAALIVDKGPKGRTALHAAVIRGHSGIVMELLKEKPDLIKQVDTFRSNALHYAASSGNLDILQLLLQMDPSLAYLSDEDGLSPLHIAAGSGHLPLVQAILLHCPDSHELLDGNGRNVLHIAVENGETNVIQHLLKIPGLQDIVNDPDNDKNTPLHLATIKDNYEIVKLLLQLQSLDSSAMNKDGLTALDIAELKSERTHQQILTWRTLEVSGAARGRRRHSREKPPRPTPNPATVDESYKIMANTLSVVAALIATITFAAVFTMPGGNKNEGERQGTAVLMRRAAFKVFVIADTVAMCTSMIVALVLVWAVPGVPGMLVNAVRCCLRLMWIALGGMVVTFVTAVFVVISTDCMWLAILVCVMGCSVPFLVTPIVTLSARQTPHGKKDFQYDQIQPVLP